MECGEEYALQIKLAMGEDNKSENADFRQRAEELLKASESRYRRLFESAKDGILILDAETGMIADVNPFMIEMLGYSKHHFLDKAIWEIVFFKDLFANQDKLSELKQKEYVRYDDLPLETADGRKISVEFVSNSYFENNKKLIQCNIRETTIRKQSELALSNSETHLRTLLQTIPDLIWLKDTKGVYLTCNTMFERFFGAREADIVGKTDYDFVDRELADSFRANDLKAMEAGKPTSNEEWISFADDGHRAFLETIKTPMYDSDGSLIGILGIGRDITSRMLAEQKLKQSEERFRAIFDQAPIAIALIDLQGHPIISNPPLSKMLGYSTDELSKMTFAEFTWPEDIDKDMNQFTDLLAGKISGYSMEKRYIHKNGKLIWANLFVTTLRDNNGMLSEIFAMVGDITEKKGAEAKLSNSEERFKILFDYAPDAYFLTDLKGNIIDGNIAAVKMIGYDINELTGKSFFKLELIPPSEFLKAAALLAKNLLGQATGPDVFVLNQKSGSKISVEISTYPVRIQDQNIVLGIARDITKRKSAEKELIEAKEKAEESDRLKSAFLANMSHEVRTPLNSIIGFSELLVDPDFEEDQKNEFIQHIIASGNNLLNIISDIMDISKMESGEITIRKTHLNAQKYISDVYEQFSFLAGTHKLELILSLPDNDEKTVIFADSERLMQIFNNLLGNALKFTPEGKIEIGYQPIGKMVEFFVKDTGIGIPTEYHDKIFDRFRQVEGENTRKYGGNGLGLAITKKLVELMGGKIRLESKVGEGSKFYFTMPGK
jgi:PAS domain S-box-containing protein